MVQFNNPPFLGYVKKKKNNNASRLSVKPDQAEYLICVLARSSLFESVRNRGLAWKPPLTKFPLLVLIIHLEGRGDLETAQPPWTIIGFIELARSQSVYIEAIDTVLSQSKSLPWSVQLLVERGGPCKTMLVSLQKSLQKREGGLIPQCYPIAYLRTGLQPNGLLQIFSQTLGF